MGAHDPDDGEVADTRGQACARRRAGPGVGRRAGAWAATAVLVAGLAAGCGAQTPTPATAASASPAAAAPVATPSPTSVAHADTLRIGVDLDLYGSWQPYTEWQPGIPALTLGRLVFSSLYRYDAHFNPVPDLADGPCFVPGSDDKVIRCRLIETTFQDGTPLTADDVAYTYQVMQRPVMGGVFAPGFQEVRVVDPRTVEFVLPSVDPTFLTLTLPLTPIFSRHSIDEAVATFDAATRGLTAEGLAKLAADINAEINADPPVCSEALLAQARVIYRRLGYLDPGEGPLTADDVCLRLSMGAFNLDPATNTLGGSIGYALGQTGIDRVAGIVGQMAWGRPELFAGTGPYRIVSRDADRVHFEAWPGYHGGMAATKYVDFVRARGDGSDLVAGAVDILPRADLGTAFLATAAAQGVRVVNPPLGSRVELIFNVRPGRLFSDVNLRRALQLCIDLKRDVDAATGGAGTPIYGPVLPGSWADDPDLPKPDRDVAAARRLIEAAGWTLGSDGVYAKGGDRLGATILTNAKDDERVKMADLIANEARGCGMDVRAEALDGLGEVFRYPHEIPGTKTPFDLVLVWSDGGPDPDPGLSQRGSSAITDAAHPDGSNFGGFSDPAFDALVAAGKATYDQAERTRIYRQAREELAAQVPAIFLWAGYGYDALRPAVATVDGPLDLAAPYWAWQPERLVVTASP